MNQKEIEILSKQIKSEDWKTSLSAAEGLGDIGTFESIKPLLDCLKSSDGSIRNAAALGLMRTKNQKYLEALMSRINELGYNNNDRGTLVFALQEFDCSRHLYDIASFFLKGNYEVKSMAAFILNKQTFKINKEELKIINDLLNEFNYSLDSFKIVYELICNN